MTAGYSGTPLPKKLGIKQGFRVGTFGAPSDLAELLSGMPDGAVVVRAPRTPCQVLLIFAKTPATLSKRFDAAIRQLPSDGGLWIGWPKKSSGVATTLDFGRVQKHGLGHGLVDNKVAAISDVWSGLRFVVRKENRQTWLARSSR